MKEKGIDRVENINKLGPGIFSPYLVSVPRFPVSVWGRGRAGAWPISVGPTGLLAPGLLLRPTLAYFVPLRRTDCSLTRAGVRSTQVVVWSVSVSRKQSDTNEGINACTEEICASPAHKAAAELLTCLVCLSLSSVCGEDHHFPALLPDLPKS